MAFFKKKKEELKLEGKESAVSSEELLTEKDENIQEDEDIQTELSIHPDWNIPKEDEYAYRFLNLECPPLKPNQLSLSGISLMKEGEDYRVTAFIRNSLNKSIRLNEITLVLLNEEEQLLGRKKFNFQEVGEIPARSSRPWHFIFTKKDLFTEDLPERGWKLAFWLTPSMRKHSLDLAESWKKSLAAENIKKLEEIVDSLAPPKPGEVNFMGLQARFAENGDLHVTLLIRNGSEKDINLEQIPLHVKDADDDIVAFGLFKLKDFTVKANTSKPWTFIFPKSLVKKEKPNFERWVAYVPQK